MSIQKYKPWVTREGTIAHKKHSSGGWVKFADHEAELAAEKAKTAKLMEIVREYRTDHAEKSGFDDEGIALACANYAPCHARDQRCPACIKADELVAEGGNG